MTIAVYPGSFDPLTNGHTDIVRRSLRFFDRVVVGVLSHPEKNALFTVEERVKLINLEFADCAGKVEARSFSGLLVDFVKTFKNAIVIRGLRAVSDYDYEAQMALLNKTLDEGLETFFLVAREQNSYISSTLVKQVALLGGSVDKLVPKVVADALAAKRAELQNKKG